MQSLSKKVFPFLPIVVACCCLSIIAISTNFFTTLTWEAARQKDIAQTQPSLSFLKVRNQEGKVFNLATLAKSQKKAYIVEFVYTQCQSLCLALGSAFQQAQAQILARGLQSQLGLISVSFDVESDTRNRLQAYQKRMHIDEHVWTVSTMVNQTVFEDTAKQLGLIVISDGVGGYTHNSAFLVLKPNGHIAGMFPPNNLADAITLALHQ